MSENEKPKDQPPKEPSPKESSPKEPVKDARAEKPATKFRENPLPVSALCEKEKLSPVLRAAVMTAYGWKVNTQLIASEFKRKVEAWLKQPASAGGGR